MVLTRMPRGASAGTKAGNPRPRRNANTQPNYVPPSLARPLVSFRSYKYRARLSAASKRVGTVQRRLPNAPPSGDSPGATYGLKRCPSVNRPVPLRCTAERTPFGLRTNWVRFTTTSSSPATTCPKDLGSFVWLNKGQWDDTGPTARLHGNAK